MKIIKLSEQKFVSRINLEFVIIVFFIFTSLNSYSQTFFESVNQIIPDNNTIISFEINVTGLPNVIDANFGLATACVNITHPYCADMEVKLQAPDGTTTLLFSGIGGGNQNFTNTCLAGTGNPIAAANAPFSGTFQSMSVLGNLNNGQNPNGIWKLLCRDTYGADEGFMIDWQITFNNTPALPFVFMSSTIPIVKLTTINLPINDDAKVPVLMQIIDNGPGMLNFTNTADYAYEGVILTEWQGFSGPTYPKKNFDFDLVDTFSNKIEASLMGLPIENDFIFKAEYLDHSLIKNTLTYEFARRMGNYAPRTRPCEIILDGEYIGYYTLTESIKRDINRVDIANLSTTDTAGIALTGGYIIEMNINGDPGAWNSAFEPINAATAGNYVEFKYVDPKAINILPVQANYIKSYVDSFEMALNETTFLDNEIGYRNFIDVPSFIDFLIVNEFSVNYDSYGRSTFMYKEKDTDGGLLKIGPSWDYDRALDYNNINSAQGWVWELTHLYWPFPFWWSKMYTQDTKYQKELACRWKTLRQNEFKTESFLSFIDSMAIHLQEPALRNFTIWNELGTQTYNDEIELLKTYIQTRLNWIDNELDFFLPDDINLILPNDTLACNFLLFDAAKLNNETLNYNWQPGPDSSLIKIDQTGYYPLKVTDEYGCFKKDTLNVTINKSNDTIININATKAFVYEGINYLKSGIYQIIKINTSGCDSLIYLNITICNKKQNMLVSPNPTEGEFQIDLPTQYLGERVIIFDYSGKIVWSEIYKTLNQRFTISQLAAGVYFLKIGNQNQKTKIIKISH